MIIEVTGSSTRNKGAELMLGAVRERFGVPSSTVTLAVTPGFGGVRDRLRYNLATKLEWRRWGRSRLAMSLAPASFRHAVGLYNDRDIDAVLDISGFAFGDQHPVRRTVEFADQVVHWKELGKQVILLPQAFGPFESEPHRNAFQRVVSYADLIYARDDVSRQHLDRFAGSAGKVRQAPDITIGYHGGARPDADGGVLIVPNTRMLDKSDALARKQYIPLLQACIRAAQPLAGSVRLLIHDAVEDRALVPKIQAGLDQPLSVVEENDPVALKRHLAGARLVIGSRFHALVGALSSGVPVLATGWSHKYEMLLNDYECPGSILNLNEPNGQIQEKVIKHLDKEFQEATRKQLNASQAGLADQVNHMWREVVAVLASESRDY